MLPAKTTMWAHRLRSSICVLSVLLMARTAAAQTVGITTGAVTGTVTDQTGAVLPGATVVIAGRALLGGPKEAITSTAGVYRFVALEPGEYTLEVQRRGYSPVRSDPLPIVGGAIVTLDVTLKAAVESSVVVLSSPVTKPGSTAGTARFDRRELASLPMTRSMPGILSATPAVDMARFDVGGNSGASGGVYGAYGTFGFNHPSIEGIFIAGIMATALPLDYGSFEEAVVATSAHGPELPSAGVHAQFLSKSGGDYYHGTLHADYQHRHWQSYNIDADQTVSRDANRQWNYHDINADVGGFIRRDTTWWYASARHQEIAARQVNFLPAPLSTRLGTVTAKVTHQLTPNHRFVAFAYGGRTHQPYRLDSFVAGNALTAINESIDSTTRLRAHGGVWKMEWNGSLDDKWFVEARAGQFLTHRSERPNGAGPRIEDTVLFVVRGGNRDFETGLRRTQVAGSISRFAGGSAGTHQIKVGGEFTRNVDSEQWRASYANDVLHVVRSGVPSEVYLFSTPSLAQNGLQWLAFHGGDSWRVNRMLTVNLGVRVDRYRLFLPAQQHPATGPVAQVFAEVPNLIDWNVLAPRLGVAWDLTGDVRTIVKASYGQYWFAPGNVGVNANPNSAEWWRNYRWSDANRNGTWEPGEEDATQLLRSRGGVALESVDPNLELSYVHEATGWLERQFGAHVGVRTGVVWRVERQSHSRQNLTWPFDAFSEAKTIIDPGPDGDPNSSDDGPPIQVHELAASSIGLAPQHVVKNVGGVGSSHLTWEISVKRRFSNRWSMAAAFAHSWNRDQASGYFGQSLRSNPYPLTPNDMINADQDGRYRFTTWTFKAHGSWEGPWGLRVVPLLRVQSGQPFGRTFTTALNYANSVRVLAEPVGTRRMANVALFDLRTEKQFALGSGRHTGVFLDVFNLLNVNPEQNINWSSGPLFLRPSVIVAPRIARVGVKLYW